MVQALKKLQRCDVAPLHLNAEAKARCNDYDGVTDDKSVKMS